MRVTLESLRNCAEVNLLGGTVRHVDRSNAADHPLDDYLFVNLPYCGVSYQAPKQGFIADLRRLLGLNRLGSQGRRLRQLQLLTPYHVNSHTPLTEPPHNFTHTRWQHALGAAALADLMARNIGMAEPLAKTAIALDLTHDIMTPAGDDAVKQYFKQYEKRVVDEDDQYPTIFHRHAAAWYQLRERYGLPADFAQQMAASINGAGLLGQLHKLADASSYLSLDIEQLRLGFERQWGRDWLERCPARYREIFDLVDGWPLGLWQSVKMSGDVAVIEDTRNLHGFLKLHTLMWRFYTNYEAKFLEQVFIHVIAPYLSQRGLLEPGRLMKWDDNYLYGVIDRELGTEKYAWNLNFLGAEPHSEIFATRQEALRHEAEIAEQGGFTLLWCTDNFPPIKTKTELLFVPGMGGQPVSYKRAFPAEAQRLQDIAAAEQRAPQWVVYYVAKTLYAPQMPPAFKQAWLQARQRWLKQP